MATQAKKEPAHVTRMRSELAELTERANKLDAFMKGRSFQGLDPQMRALMATQHNGMEQYRGALASRLYLETEGTDGDQPPQA